MATQAERDRDSYEDAKQSAWEEANDIAPCEGDCGETASRVNGWYLANGHGPYCEQCYDRIAEPPDAEDVTPGPEWYDKPERMPGMKP